MYSEWNDKVERLLQKGVAIPNPRSVLIGDEVELDRIAGEGVVIYPGCKIFGKETLIMSGARLGYEGPVTIEDCQIGPNVELRGGSFDDPPFLRRLIWAAVLRSGTGAFLKKKPTAPTR